MQPPAAIVLTLLGVKSYHLGVNTERMFDLVPIDRDLVAPPPEIAESYGQDAPTLLKPIFDALWNAVGASACGDYDASGHPNKELQQQLQGRW